MKFVWERKMKEGRVKRGWKEEEMEEERDRRKERKKKYFLSHIICSYMLVSHVHFCWKTRNSL